MNTKFYSVAKKTVSAVFFAVFGLGTVFASPVSISTANLFRNDSDDLKSIIHWGEADVENLLVSTDVYYNYVDFIGGIKVGDILIAPRLKLSTIDISSTKSESTSNTKVYDSDEKVKLISSTSEYDEYSITKISQDTKSNEFSVLAGFGSIGVKGFLNWDFSHTKMGVNPDNPWGDAVHNTKETEVTLDADGNTVTVVTETEAEGKYNSNYLFPKLVASYELSSDSIKLIPFIGFGSKFNFSTRAGKTIKKETDKDDVEKSYSYTHTNYVFNPDLGVFVSLAQEKLTHELTAEYYANFYALGKNKYTDAFDVEKKAYNLSVKKEESKQENGIYTTKGNSVYASYSEESLSYNYLYFKYAALYELNERLNIGASAATTLSLSNSKSQFVTESTSKSVTTEKDGDTTRTFSTNENTNITKSNLETSSSLSLVPVFSSGFTYEAVPGKFFVNGGVKTKINTMDFSKTTETSPEANYSKQVITDKDGVQTITEGKSAVVADSSETKKSVTIEGITATVYTGFSWFLDKNFIIDTSLQLGNNGSSKSVFDYSLDVGATLKF